MTLVANSIRWFILLTLTLSVTYSVLLGSWSTVFVIGLSLILISIPVYLERRFGMQFSRRLKFWLMVFIFATIFLGEVNSFYDDIWWWDSLWHFIAGLGLTTFGFVILTHIYNQTTLRSVPAMTSFFALCFSGLMIALWEIFEFSVDLLYFEKAKMQPSNYDSMIDMLLGIVASLIVCVLGFRYLKHKEKNFVSEIVETTSLTQ